MSIDVRPLLILGLCGLAGGTAFAFEAVTLEDYSGEEIYMRFCASCHGSEGQGDGPVFDSVLRWFQEGGVLELDDTLSSGDLFARLRAISGLEEVAHRYLALDGDAHVAAAMEFVLEGLAQSSLLSREDLHSGHRFRDMLSEMADSLRR